MTSKAQLVIGHVTAESARIWVCGRGLLTILVTSASGREQALQAVVGPDAGYTAVVDLQGLESDCCHQVKIVEEDCHGTFRTFPAAKTTAPFQFLLNSCNFHGWGPFRSHRVSCQRRLELAKDCRFAVHAGDQIYADQPWPSLTLEDYRTAYRRAWDQPDTRSLLSSLPNYMVADDHEVLDGFAWDGSFTLYQRVVMGLRGNFRPSPQLYHEVASNGMRSFDEFQSAHGPRTYAPSRYFSFNYGCHQFFALDLRFERQLRQGRMISEAQREALFAWLLLHRERPKFIITSTPFLVETVGAAEKWCGPEFSRQRHQIIDFLGAEKLANVAFLSGDIHASCHAEMEIQAVDGEFFRLHELCASPLNGTLQRSLRAFHHSAQRTTEEGTRYRVRLDKGSFLGKPAWGGTSNSAFMLVTVDGNQVTYDLHRSRVREAGPARSGGFWL